MIRTTDAVLVNELMARDFPGSDLSELLAEPLHVCLIEGPNGAMFAWRGPGIYEIHLFYEVRGRAALNLFATMIDAMRDMWGGRFFWALIPASSRHVRLFARLTGFLSEGVVETRHGPQELFVSEKPVCLLS